MSKALTADFPDDDERVLSPFEFWPGWLFYTPVVIYWIALGTFYRSLSLPTAANPNIEAGGLCGESKTAVLDQVDQSHRSWVADYVTMITGQHDDVSMSLELLARAKIPFPIVVKPDVGCHGNGVRLVRDVSLLKGTLAKYPSGVRLLLQRFVPFDGEAGIFYVRVPGSPGRITSLTLKHAPSVKGDGQSSLRELIESDARNRRTARFYYARLSDRLDQIVPAEEIVQLVFTGNHCKGSIFRNGEAEITSSLTRRIDEICRSMRDFHFGRIDLRFSNVSDLRRGENFQIIEVNGVGSEATHIWDPRTRLVDAYRAQFQHYGLAFKIGRMMRRIGHRPTSILQLSRLWRRQNLLMASYPEND